MRVLKPYEPNDDDKHILWSWSAIQCRCVNCGHEWVAVIPTMVMPSECPNCGGHPLRVVPTPPIAPNFG